MTETRIEKARTRLAMVYGAGILAFTGIVGVFTLVANFLAIVRVT
jgi:hypothetical protein